MAGEVRILGAGDEALLFALLEQPELQMQALCVVEGSGLGTGNAPASVSRRFPAIVPVLHAATVMRRNDVLSALALVLMVPACLTDPEPRVPEAEAAPAPPPAPRALVEAPPSGKTCSGATRPAADGLIDDLEDGDSRAAAAAGRTGSWWIAKADHATVTTPAGAFAPSAGGAPGSTKAVRFAGKTDSQDDWGAAVGLNFLESGGFYDASKYAGVTFKIKASKPNTIVRVKFPDVSTIPEGGLCGTTCWNSFGKDLVTGPEWQDVVLTWAELSQQSDWGNPRPPAVTVSKLKNIEWAVYQGVEFDVVVDDIRFIECG